MRLNRYACAHSLMAGDFTTRSLPSTSGCAAAQLCERGTPTRRFCGGPTATWRNWILAACRWASTRWPSTRLPRKILQPGDALIFFTDGVVEAFDESGAEFAMSGGWRPIRTLPEVSAAESLQFLMTRVDAFVRRYAAVPTILLAWSFAIK